MAATASPVRTRAARSALEQAVIWLFFTTLAIVTVRGIERAPTPFIGPHAFVSANVATSARTFATEGILRLHGIPVSNNPPIHIASDAYTHWPPLLPILLGLCFRIFGASERVGHLFMLAILIATAVLIYRLGSVWLGTIGGALAGFFWLTLPIVVQFGDLICQQSLAMLFVVAALLAFTARRDRLASLLFFLAVLSSWEALLVLPGFWLVAFRRPELRRSAIHATLAASLGLLFVTALYLYYSPSLALDLLQIARYYMGLSNTYSTLVRSDREALTLSQQIINILWSHLWMLGALGLGAILQLILVRPQKISPLIVPLAAPWVLWTAVMHTHTAIHHFELLIAAPLTAFALAWLASAVFEKSQSHRALNLAILPIATAVQLLVLPHPRIPESYPPKRLMQYGTEIKDATQPGSIVMAPLLSEVPIYYSERHIIRDIEGDEAVSTALPKLRQTFPGARLYLAIPPFLSANFPSTLATGKIVSRTSDAIIVQL